MAKAKSPRVFVPLIKVDEEQRLVYGRITRQEEDQSGEVMDYATSKPHFEKWSSQIEEASGGLSKGNVRVMHGLKAAGKLTDIEFDDDDQSIEVCAKIVDDGEWEMVKEGVYTGFSVGGRYGKKWKEDGVSKFTAVPNEVSLVDNPCVKSATFTMLKADGAEEEVEFKSAEDEELEKTETTEEADEAEGTTDDATSEESTEEETETVEKSHAPPQPGEPANADVVAKAEEMAKAANDGTTWMQHVEAAREELMKGMPPAKDGKKKKDAKAAKETGDDSEKEENEVEKAAGDDFTIANRLSQKWVTSDGQSFEKKADAEAHEDALIKAAQPKTEAEKLRDRLNKAIKDPEPEAAVELMDDYDRLGKVWNALTTPFGDDGQPVLEKGMYTVERFARVLWDLGKLTKCIAREGAEEGTDSEDETVAASIKAAMSDLGESFKVYVADQIDELLMGIDDEAYVSYYDYYYAAAKEEGDNELAKDVCSILETHKDSSRVAREEQAEELVKAYGIVLGSVEETEEDDLSPPMRKRFDELEANNQELTKIAGEAIERVEEMAKRLQDLEEAPAPRAPNPANIAFKDGDGYNMFGKKYGSQEDLIVGLDTMLKTEGPEAVAMKMIRAAHQHGGHKLDLAR